MEDSRLHQRTFVVGGILRPADLFTTLPRMGERYKINGVSSKLVCTDMTVVRTFRWYNPLTWFSRRWQVTCTFETAEPTA